MNNNEQKKDKKFRVLVIIAVVLFIVAIAVSVIPFGSSSSNDESEIKTTQTVSTNKKVTPTPKPATPLPLPENNTNDKENIVEVTPTASVSEETTKVPEDKTSNTTPVIEKEGNKKDNDKAEQKPSKEEKNPSKENHKPTKAPEKTQVGESDVLDKTKNNNSDSDIEAKKIIANAMDPSAEDKITPINGYFDNTDEYFLKDAKKNAESYAMIIDDLVSRTGDARDKIQKFYDVMNDMLTSDKKLGDYIYHYYKNAYISSKESNKNIERNSGFKYADGEDITVEDVILYFPYYISGCVNGNKIPTLDAMCTEMGEGNKEDLFISELPEFFIKTNQEEIPLQESIAFLANFYDAPKKYKNVDFEFSSPIKVSSGYGYYNFTLLGKRVETDFLVPFRDKTHKFNGIAFFTADKELFFIVVQK